MNVSIKLKTSSLKRHPIDPFNQAGLSLVELMISITIGLILLAGITTLIVRQSNARDELDKSSRQIENGRYAMEILHNEIEHAGFYGESSIQVTPVAFPNPCATSLASMRDGMELPIQGYDSPSTVPTPLSACLSDAIHKDGTDILVIRRADTNTGAIGAALAGQIYLQTTSTGFELGSGSDTSVFTLLKKDNTTPADLRRYHVNIYFVSPCNVAAGGGTTCTGSADDNGNPVPTLKRLELTPSGSNTVFSLTSLVEGIDQLQLDYGLDTDDDGTPDSYATAPASPTSTAAWADVMAIRVNLLARNNDPTPNYQDSKTYTLGAAGNFGPYNDTYKRHSYNQLVRAINPSGRRE